jgi:hypothetical protein
MGGCSGGPELHHDDEARKIVGLEPNAPRVAGQTQADARQQRRDPQALPRTTQPGGGPLYLRYDRPMAAAVHLEPDPFDKVVEELLSDPQLQAELDEQHAKIDRGEAKLYSEDEVATRLRALGVPLPDEDASGE